MGRQITSIHRVNEEVVRETKILKIAIGRCCKIEGVHGGGDGVRTGRGTEAGEPLNRSSQKPREAERQFKVFTRLTNKRGGGL